MKLYKNLKTGMHHYAASESRLCSRKPLNLNQWIEVDAEPRNLILMCARCDELAANMKRTGYAQHQNVNS